MQIERDQRIVKVLMYYTVLTKYENIILDHNVLQTRFVRFG